MLANLAMSITGLNQLFTDWPGLPPQPDDLYRLYRNIRRRKPEYVVEYGSGCSTIVMAAALCANGQGRLFTYEANSKWLVNTDNCTPEHLRRFVTLIHAPTYAIGWHGIACHRYERDPAWPIDFMYLDGPDPADIDGWEGAPLAIDPILHEPKFRPGFRLIVDGRAPNAKLLEKHFKRHYLVEHDRKRRFSTFTLNEASPYDADW